MNGFHAGQDPISDQTFAAKFEKYYDQVYKWCRQNFRDKYLSTKTEMRLWIQMMINNRWDGPEILKCSGP